MPFNAVDTSQSDKNYLQSALDIRSSVLSTYLSEINDIQFTAPGWIGRTPQEVIKNWRFCNLISPTGSENSELFTQLDAVFTTSSLPSHVTVIASYISEVFPSIEEALCSTKQPIEFGFKRYCIPLRSDDKCLLHITEDAGGDADGFTQYSFDEGSVFDFDNPEKPHKFSSSLATGSSIIWFIDVLENDNTTDETLTSILEDSWRETSSGALWKQDPIID